MTSFIWCFIALATCVFAPFWARLLFLCFYSSDPRQWSALKSSRRLAWWMIVICYPFALLLMFTLDNHVYTGVVIGVTGLLHAAFQSGILLDQRPITTEKNSREALVISICLTGMLGGFLGAPFSGLMWDEYYRKSRIAEAASPAVRAFPSEVQHVVLEDRTCYQITPRLLSAAAEKFDRPVIIRVPVTPESKRLFDDYEHRVNVPPVLEFRGDGQFITQAGYLVYNAKSASALKLLRN